MTRLQGAFSIALFFSIGLFVSQLCGPSATAVYGQEKVSTSAASTSAASTSGGSTSAMEIRVGIRGIYRPGNWTAIRVAEASKGANRSPFVEIGAAETLDGNGTRVRYLQPPIEESDRDRTWAYAVPGTVSAPLSIFAQTAAEKGDAALIAAGRFPPTGIETSKPWVVVIGDPLGIETIGKNDLLGRDASVATSIIESSDELPDATAGWEGVDLLVINQPGAAILSELSESQIETIQAWVRGGGRLFVSLGKGGTSLLEKSPWLARLTSVAADSPAIRLDPAALETFTSSQSRLSPLDGITLPETGGRTLIMGRAASRQPARLAIEHLVGLGRVVVISFALDSPELTAWPQRLSLVTRLHQGLLDIETEKRRESRSINSVPYDDLAGQLRA
ncbi:MAG TPA: hypothetical protein DDZ51_22610 [Planctomycetaceae bacterium]|nr:hypothetical protein [Planctomycetaceae bacterium]